MTILVLCFYQISGDFIEAVWHICVSNLTIIGTDFGLSPVRQAIIWSSAWILLYPPYPKDRGMLWFYVEAACRPPPAMVLTR